MKISDEINNDAVDITKLFLNYSSKYRNVFICQIENNTFIYRALGRAEYRDILKDQRFNDLQKEELLCQQCLLYPDPFTFDWDNCDAGVPTQLRQHILKNSYLDGLRDRFVLRDVYREEMFDLDNQITCIISEAFPQYDIEEIESWDVEKTTKYLTRAEWKLSNLRNVEFYDNGQKSYDLPASSDPFKHTHDPLMTKMTTMPTEELVPYKDAKIIEYEEEKQPEPQTTIRGGDKKEKLTPEKLKKQQEFFAKFPQFANDDVANKGIKGLEQSNVETTPPALRPGF